jgi:hypothetical protein
MGKAIGSERFVAEGQLALLVENLVRSKRAWPRPPCTGEFSVEGDLRMNGVTLKIQFAVGSPTPPTKDP